MATDSILTPQAGGKTIIAAYLACIAIAASAILLVRSSGSHLPAGICAEKEAVTAECALPGDNMMAFILHTFVPTMDIKKQH